MELTKMQKLLIYGLTLFGLDEETQLSIFLLMQTAEQQAAMIVFLQTHENATEQQILKQVKQILEVT